MLPVDNLDQLGPHGVTVHCNQLSVAEMLLPTGGPRSIELDASENVVVESRTFTALAQRITYNEAKDLLILSGEGAQRRVVPPTASRRRTRPPVREDPLLPSQDQPHGECQRGPVAATHVAPEREWKTLTSPGMCP